MDFATQVAGLAANREKVFRYAFLLQFVAAIPFLWFGYITGKVHARILMHGTTARGTVVAVVPVHFSSKSGSSSTAYEAVVTFAAGSPPHADEYRFQEWKATEVRPIIGSQLPVLYDTEDPDTAMVDRGYLNYLPWAPFAAIGVFLFVVATKGLLTLLFRR